MTDTFTGEHLLSIRNVTKRYGDLVAVNNVSLDIRPGEIFALLGANGAGKTTLIGCTTGLISQFDGEIRVAGYDVKRDYRTARQLVGLVPQELNFDGFFKAGELLRYQGGYFGAPAGVVRERREHLLQSFALKEKEDANTRRLSGGMKRRLMICKALMHEPVLLFLDEPTAGVDVELREELWNYIRGLRNEGTTIVLTTHYLEEAEQLADRIGIINRGRLLRVDAREDLMRAFGRRWIEVLLSGPASAALMDKLKQLHPEQTAPNRLKITIKEKQAADREEANSLFALMEALREEGMTIETVESGRSRLEDIFKEVVKQDYRNGDGRDES